MDEIFKTLEKKGKTDVDSLIKWMKDSKLIEASKEQEQKARAMFKDAADAHRIELDKFKSVVNKLAEEQKKTFDELSKLLAAEGPMVVNATREGMKAFKSALEGTQMDEIFKALEKKRKTDVDSLIKWMKDSKLIEASKEQEQKARAMFKDAADAHRIELDKFKSVVTKLAEEQKKTFDELSKQLAAEGPKLMNAAREGMKAFKSTLEGSQMEDIFKKLEETGKTDVDSLIKWMKDSKLIEASKEQEQKARAMFKDAADGHRIELDKFKSVVTKLAEEQKKTFDELSELLATEGAKLLNAVKEGVKAFKSALEPGSSKM